MSAALYVRTQSYQFVGSNDLKRMTGTLQDTIFIMFFWLEVKFNQFYNKRQTYLHYSLVYNCGNKAAATGFKVTLKRKKEKKNVLEIDPLKMGYHNVQQILFFCLCVWDCSPAVCLVRLVLLGEGKVRTKSAHLHVQPSSPDQTTGSRNSELDLQVYSPIKTRRVNAIFIFRSNYAQNELLFFFRYTDILCYVCPESSTCCN